MKEEPPVRNFQLPRDTKTYDGTTKPEDWLADYVTAVYIAVGGGTVTGGGNRRWAVRIVPSFLVGPARIWLNNFPAGSINGWLDFEKAFVSNFSSTYRRPNRPQQLALCVQRSNETDRDYLTRWNSTRNSCEGIIEATTRKVAMADEVEVAPWLLVYHGRRFWVPPWCMSKLFFSRF
jgi:hypothetical protein